MLHGRGAGGGARAVGPGEALERLAGVITSLKKFPGASRLVLGLLAQEGPAGLRKKEHGELLFRVLAASMDDPTAPATPELRRWYRQLFLGALGRSEVLPLRRHEAVHHMALRAVALPELLGDDSFAFNAAVAKVEKAMDALPGGEGRKSGGGEGADGDAGVTPGDEAGPGSPPWLRAAAPQTGLSGTTLGRREVVKRISATQRAPGRKAYGISIICVCCWCASPLWHTLGY